jgi:hypothetical protein
MIRENWRVIVSWVTAGADFGTMLTGLSAATATVLWVRTRLREWRVDRDARRDRNWNGFIVRENVPTWFVRVVAEKHEGGPERVVLDVVNVDGSPNVEMAHALRLYVREGGRLTLPPSPAQWDFLQDLRRARFGAPEGFPIF